MVLIPGTPEEVKGTVFILANGTDHVLHVMLNHEGRGSNNSTRI
jgi:hypothetical protein